MEWKEPHRREMAQQIIRTLLALSESDGNLNESELLYIVQVGDRIGIDIEEIRSIASGQYRQEFLIPTSEEERMSLLFYLMLLMKVDEEIADSEEKMIYEVGFKLGFNELMIRDMLVVLKTNLHKKLPPDALLKEVKKYLN